MKVRWDLQRRYRAFSEPSRNVVSLVSSCISDEANGVTLDEVLLLVTDRTCRFCDLELKLDPAHRTGGPIALGDPSIIQDEVESEVSETEHVLWWYESGTRVLQVVLGNDPVERWTMLRGGEVIIGLGANQSLRVVHCQRLVSDPSGKLQSQWLQDARQGKPSP